MKLYVHPMSSNAVRAVAVARHLELPVDLELVDLAKGAHRQPAFLALNPMGQVPVLVDGDLTLAESYAIAMYLCTKVPAQTLYPSAPAARAKVDQWMFWAANSWSPHVGALNYENMLKAMFGHGAPDEARVKRHNDAIARAGGVLDAHLATRTWMVGDGITLADYAIASALITTVPAKLPVGGLANVQRWFQAVGELPAWKAATSMKF